MAQGSFFILYIMLKLIKKSKKEHISDSGILIPKGSPYAIKKSIIIFDDYDYYNEKEYAREIFTYNEYRDYIKLIYKEKQRKVRFENFIKKIETEFGIKWSAYEYDAPSIKYKKGISLEIKVGIRSMVTDDPFPMYDDFIKQYFFKPE